MTWLFPLYLLGAGAIVLPIVLHLRRRAPKDRVVFSSLMFLEKSPQLFTKRSKLEQLLLLALRCLALLLLALMFSRPFVRGRSDASLAGKGEAVVLLLDGSASMRRDDLWSRAIAAVEERVRKAKPVDRVAVVRFDRESKTLWSFDQDSKSAGGRVAPIQAALKPEKPGWAATDLGQALVDAASRFQQSAPTGNATASKRIVLVSDLQDGARLDALRGFAWPDDVEVEVVQVSAPGTDNLSLSLAATESDENSGKIEMSASREVPGVRVRVSNVRESKVDNFSLQWENANTEPLSGYLTAGSSRVLRSPPAPGKNRPLAGSAAAGSLAGSVAASGDVLTLTGDAWDFDNRIYLAPPQPREARVTFIGDSASANEAASPLYYLTRALQPTASLKPVLEVNATLTGASLAFVQSGAVEPQVMASLRQWIQQGGFAVLVLPADANPTELSMLTDAKTLAVTESTGAEYAMLGDVDGAHPLLHPFADTRLRDFTKIRFWHHRLVQWKDDEPNRPEVLAKFDNGDPAMLLWSNVGQAAALPAQAATQRVAPLSKGQLLVLTSGWHPADSQLALSTKFVPLLFGWLEAAGFSHEAAQNLLVGDALPIGDARSSIVQPDGTTIESAGGIARAEMPGFFKITQGGETRVIAVNLPPEEGRIHPMEPQKLAEAGVKLAGGGGDAGAVMTAEEKQRLDAGEEEARQRMWLWVLVSLLAVLVWETWLAGRKHNHQTVPV